MLIRNCYLLRPSYLIGTDATNGGHSKGKDAICVSTDGADLPDKAFTDDGEPIFDICPGNIPGLLKVVPRDQPKRTVGAMMGGAYVIVKDGLRFPYPLPVHDRFETQEEYDRYSA